MDYGVPAESGRGQDLNYLRSYLWQSLRFWLLASAFFAVVILYAWFDASPKAKIVVAICSIGLMITVWVVARSGFLLATRTSAAEINEAGIRISTHFSSNAVPWAQITGVRKTTVPTGKTLTEVLEIEAADGRPIRLPLDGIAQPVDHIEQWIGCARSKLRDRKSPLVG